MQKSTAEVLKTRQPKETREKLAIHSREKVMAMGLMR